MCIYFKQIREVFLAPKPYRGLQTLTNHPFLHGLYIHRPNWINVLLSRELLFTMSCGSVVNIFLGFSERKMSHS